MKPFIVDSKNRHNDSKIQVNLGEIYSFYASGCWVDWFIPCGPNGWILKKVFKHKPILENVPIFKLCACIDKEITKAFPIGKKLENKVMTHTGRLYFFANDVDGYYGNNRGSVKVEIMKC